MVCSSSTDGGFPIECEVCGHSSNVNLSKPPGDSVCSYCGSFLWVSAFVERTRECSFIPDLQIACLESTTRNQSIAEISSRMADQLHWSHDQMKTFNDAVIQREEIGTTGIYPRIALPHANVDWLERCYSAVAMAPQGIDFQSYHGQKVHTIILIAAPSHNRENYFGFLERVARSMHAILAIGH